MIEKRLKDLNKFKDTLNVKLKCTSDKIAINYIDIVSIILKLEEIDKKILYKYLGTYINMFNSILKDKRKVLDKNKIFEYLFTDSIADTIISKLEIGKDVYDKSIKSLIDKKVLIKTDKGYIFGTYIDIVPKNNTVKIQFSVTYDK